MNNRNLIILSLLTVFFLFGCSGDSNIFGEKNDKDYKSSLPAALSSLAFCVTAMVGDGLILFKLSDIMLIEI